MTDLGDVQAKFADLLWEHVPIPSGAVVKLCEKELQWKKSTTYTVLRKLCEKGIFENNNGVVTAKMSKAAFYAEKSEAFVQENFQGSLPSFFAAFMSGKKISDKEADALQEMIDRYREASE